MATALTVLCIIVALGILVWGGPNALGIKRKKHMAEALRKRDEAERERRRPDPDRLL